jgi:hypothetical protein
MIGRDRRVLWLLNHKTLLDFEVPLICSLGFEVLTPKVVPDDQVGFRSTRIDYGFDRDLTIPPEDIARLNSFDLYASVWTNEITALINKYFGRVFVIGMPPVFREVLTKFKGEIYYRTFGVLNVQNYDLILTSVFGPEYQNWIEECGDRFRFAHAYEQMLEAEAPIFIGRACHLPVGLPSSLLKPERAWTGELAQILFVCPNINDVPYYRANYEIFKRTFGDFPHVIVGQQGANVDDPNVLGYVGETEYREILAKSRVFFYPSREQRHLHYAPIEAVAAGMPLVFFNDSLFSRLSRSPGLAAASSIFEARAWVERLLTDLTVVDLVRQDQRSLLEQFTEAYCRPLWVRNFGTAPTL